MLQFLTIWLAQDRPPGRIPERRPPKTPGYGTQDMHAGNGPLSCPAAATASPS